MADEGNQIRYKQFKTLIASVSVVCVLLVGILILIERAQRFLGEISPLLLTIYILTGIMAIFLTLFSVMEVKEYVSHFRNMRDDTYRSHRLTYVQVVDNESRKQLIETILEQPGIHYNLLRKKCNLHPGQFRWHISILLSYEIIKKQKIGQHVVFFPKISNDTENFDILLKFPLRDTIYQLILSNPGIILSDIARKLNIPNQRSKVKYHVDKLISGGYITTTKKGKRKELFPKN